MHISEITVHRPVLATVISLFLVLIGLVSYDKISIREYPDIDKPVVTVNTVYRGASAEIIERDITQLIPDKGAEIVLYCQGGFRSALAGESIQKMGYTNVFSMSGGYSDWINNN